MTSLMPADYDCKDLIKSQLKTTGYQKIFFIQ